MKIKFSHKYTKLFKAGSFNGYTSSAVLLDVIVVNLEDLSKTFLDYDTDSGLFPLPKKGKYMMLLFCKSGTNDLFPTLRRWTPEKEKYYRSGIGIIFDIEYVEGSK